MYIQSVRTKIHADIRMDEIFELVGGFGLYQKILCFLMVPLSTGVCGMVFYVQLLSLSTPSFTCSNPVLNFTAPEVNYSSFPHWRSKESVPTIHFQVDECQTIHSSDVVPCNEFLFDDQAMFATIASECDWVCMNNWKPYIILTCFWLANIFGYRSLSFISNKVGRRGVILCTFITYLVAGVASAFLRNFFGFLFLRIIVGTVHQAVSHLPFFLVSELCEKSRWMFLMRVNIISCSVSALLVTLLAYLVWDWQTLFILTTAPSLLVILAYPWLPESIPWLLMQGKLNDAVERLQYIANVNGKVIQRDHIASVLFSTITGHSANNDDDENVVFSRGNENVSSDAKTSTAQHSYANDEVMLSIGSFPIRRHNLSWLLIVWMSVTLCYYSFLQITPYLHPNLLFTFTMVAFAEMLACTSLLISKRFGRRLTLSVTLATAGVASLLYFLGAMFNLLKLSLIFAILGRLAATAAYIIVLLYIPDMLKTLEKGTLGDPLGSLAIFLSPSLVYLAQYHLSLPFLLFGILSFLPGRIVLLFPEK